MGRAGEPGGESTPPLRASVPRRAVFPPVAVCGLKPRERRRSRAASSSSRGTLGRISRILIASAGRWRRIAAKSASPVPGARWSWPAADVVQVGAGKPGSVRLEPRVLRPDAEPLVIQRVADVVPIADRAAGELPQDETHLVVERDLVRVKTVLDAEQQPATQRLAVEPIDGAQHGIEVRLAQALPGRQHRGHRLQQFRRRRPLGALEPPVLRKQLLLDGDASEVQHDRPRAERARPPRASRSRGAPRCRAPGGRAMRRDRRSPRSPSRPRATGLGKKAWTLKTGISRPGRRPICRRVSGRTRYSSSMPSNSSAASSSSSRAPSSICFE